MRRLAAASVIVAGMFAGAADPARAEPTHCAGALDNLVTKGDLVVADGAVCRLRGVTVSGNLLVGDRGAIELLDGVAVLGNARIDGCDYASFQPSDPAGRVSIAGNVEIRHCAEASGKISTAGHVLIGGDFVCRNNFAPCFAVSLTIGGTAAIENNAGIAYIEGNTIGGDLRCDGNDGVTDYGSPNLVGGDKLGACAALSN